MRDVPLPAGWTSQRSTAALMLYTARLTGAEDAEGLVELTLWELAKYGPCFHEPVVEPIIGDALRLLEQQFTEADLRDPRAFCRFHASIVLQRRGREALNHALSACARIATLAEPAHPLLVEMLHDASVHAVGVMSIGNGSRPHQLGADEARELAESRVLSAQPDLAGTRRRMRGVVNVFATPRGWSAAHAYAFLLHVSAFADRDPPAPIPSIANEILGAIATTVSDRTSPSVMALQAEALFDRCEGERFVVLRAVEDQLMHFAWAPPAERDTILRVVNAIAGEGVTAYRRSIISTTMAVLATSPNALPRDQRRIAPPTALAGAAASVRP